MNVEVVLVLHLQGIPNIDEKGGLIRWDRHPRPIPQRDLQASCVVRSHGRHYLWVRVLSEADQIPSAKRLELRARRVVVQPEERVALLVPQQLAQHVPRLDP